MFIIERYICIHGHFYQPPRENPWLEAVLTQDSAFPYHDWLQRVTAECYATKRVVSNYASHELQHWPHSAARRPVRPDVLWRKARA